MFANSAIVVLGALRAIIDYFAGPDKGFLEEGSKSQKGVRFVHFTPLFLICLKYPHENEIIWS